MYCQARVRRRLVPLASWFRLLAFVSRYQHPAIVRAIDTPRRRRRRRSDSVSQGQGRHRCLPSHQPPVSDAWSRAQTEHFEAIKNLLEEAKKSRYVKAFIYTGSTQSLETKLTAQGHVLKEEESECDQGLFRIEGRASRSCARWQAFAMLGLLHDSSSWLPFPCHIHRVG